MRTGSTRELGQNHWCVPASEAIGDAVNWESLSREVPNKEDIHLVSGERDFRSQLSDNHVNEFLGDEWS